MRYTDAKPPETLQKPMFREFDTLKEAEAYCEATSDHTTMQTEPALDVQVRYADADDVERTGNPAQHVGYLGEIRRQERGDVDSVLVAERCTNGHADVVEHAEDTDGVTPLGTEARVCEDCGVTLEVF